MCVGLGMNLCSYSGGEDSLKKKGPFIPEAFSYSENLSGSYAAYNNWKGQSANSFYLFAHLNLNYDSTSEKREVHLRTDLNLGFRKFIDSTWNKEMDQLEINLEWLKNENKRIKKGFSFNFNTQLVSDYETVVSDSAEAQRIWRAGFCNPSALEMNYGSSISFWKNCRIRFDYVSLRTTVEPIFDPLPEELSGFVYKRTHILNEYGFSMQTFIRKDLGKRFRWENHSRFFCKCDRAGQIPYRFSKQGRV
jgi:hypothetical protein